MLDARERAPLKGHRDMYVGADGKVDHDLSMAHAIKHAEDGFEVDRVYHRLAKFRLEVLQRYESTRQIFFYAMAKYPNWVA